MNEINKVITMKDAVNQYVTDGDTIAIEGFTAFISFAAAHEIIRQRKQDLTLVRMTPDLVYDQMIAAGVASKLVFSYLGNPGVGSLHCIRRAVEKGIPRQLDIEEYSHFGMVGRYIAGASKLPFFPLRSYTGSDLPAANPRIQFVDSPYGDGAAHQPRCDHHSCPAGRCARQYTNLGTAGDAKGSRFCRQQGHRCGGRNR